MTTKGYRMHATKAEKRYLAVACLFFSVTAVALLAGCATGLETTKGGIEGSGGEWEAPPGFMEELENAEPALHGLLEESSGALFKQYVFMAYKGVDALDPYPVSKSISTAQVQEIVALAQRVNDAGVQSFVLTRALYDAPFRENIHLFVVSASDDVKHLEHRLDLLHTLSMRWCLAQTRGKDWAELENELVYRLNHLPVDDPTPMQVTILLNSYIGGMGIDRDRIRQSYLALADCEQHSKRLHAGWLAGCYLKNDGAFLRWLYSGKRIVHEGLSGYPPWEPSGCGPFFTCIENGNANAVRKWVNAYPKIVRSKSHDDQTPLHVAIRSDEPGIVRFLLARSSPVDVKDANGNSPLYLAAQKGASEIARALRKSGANTRARGSKGLLPLHVAALEGHKSVVAVLIDSGASVDTQDVFGHTPLHLAAAGGEAEVVALLLKAGADPLAEDNFRITPLLIARRKGFKHVASLLEEVATSRQKD